MWLVPVFGAWFVWKLTRAGSGSGSLGRAFGLTLASMGVLPLFSFLAPKAGILPERLWRPNVPLTESFTIVSVFVAFAIVGLAIGILAWPALGRTLLAYGLAARIPVALLMKSSEDIVGPAQKAEGLFRATCLTPTTGAMIRKLADLDPKTLAVMHGSSWWWSSASSVRATNL